MRGQSRVASEAQSRNERQKQFDQGGVRTWIDEGKAKVFRFLEQGGDENDPQALNSFAVHPYKIRTKKGIQTRNDNTCLNDKEDGTRCPGCEAGHDRKIRGVYNVIERNRPVLRKGQDGKAMRDGQGDFIVDGYEDAVVVWDVGSITAEVIRQMDGEYRGLMSRDFTVSRTSGNSFQPYVFTPAMDEGGNAMATPMSDADRELAAKKHNLDEVWAPPSYADGAKLVAQTDSITGASGGGQGQQSPPQAPQGEQPVQSANPYGHVTNPLLPAELQTNQQG